VRQQYCAVIGGGAALDEVVAGRVDGQRLCGAANSARFCGDLR
jgi:hypothetical protein